MSKSRTNLGPKIEYEYDSASRLVSLRHPDHVAVSYRYDPAGRLLSRTLSNGSQTAYEYDQADRLARLTSRTVNGSVLQDVSYDRDFVGNITGIDDSVSGAATFAYDPLHRLREADYSGNADDLCYTYDAVGNRLTERQGVGSLTNCLTGTPPTPTYTYLYDPGNRLKEVRNGGAGGSLFKSLTHDANGSVETISGPSGLTTLVYDPRGRVASALSGGTTTSYKYDPYGYRIEKATGSELLRYELEGEHLASVKNGSNQILATFLRGVVIDEIVSASSRTSASDPFETYTYHHDGLQSLTGISGHTGTPLEVYRYQPFGAGLSETAPPAPLPPRLRFTGRELDTETPETLYYYRARYYDPSLGRFLQEDPVGFAGGLNFYDYVGNNPLGVSDPTGQCPTCLIGAGIGLVSGGFTAYLTTPNATFGDVARGAIVGAGTGLLFGSGLGALASLAAPSAAVAAFNAGLSFNGALLLGGAVEAGFAVTSGYLSAAGGSIAQQSFFGPGTLGERLSAVDYNLAGRLGIAGAVAATLPAVIPAAVTTSPLQLTTAGEFAVGIASEQVGVATSLLVNTVYAKPGG